MAEIVDFGLQQHKIKMDSRYFENVLSVVAGDTGRRIEVQLLDTNGLVQDTTGLNLRLNAVVASKATYTDATLVDAATGKYQLDLSNGMFLAPGNWQFQWQITDSVGKKLHSFAFTGNIGKNISEGGSQATNFYLNLEDLKKMQDDLINGTIDSSILETNITEKLTTLETQYAPKLNEVTTQLAQKVGGGKKAEPEDLSETTLGLVTGTGGPVSILSIPQDDSVSYEKLGSDLKKTVQNNQTNLYDPSIAVDGKLTNYNNGERVDFPTGAVTGKQPVEANKTYNFSIPSTEKGLDHIFRCYDELGVFLGISKVSGSHPVADGVSTTTQFTENGRKQVTLTVSPDSKVRMVETSMILPYATHSTADFDRVRNSLQVEEGEKFTFFQIYGTNILTVSESAMPSSYDEIKRAVGGTTTQTGNTTFIKSGNLLYVRTKWDTQNDLLQKMELVKNGGYTKNEVFQFIGHGLISSNTLTEGTTTAFYTAIKNSPDDATPLQYNGTYIGASHGAFDVINVVANSHGKTAQDVGSAWTDSSGITFYIIRVINNNELWVLSDNIATNGTWDFDTTIDGTTLTHSANATNTVSININSQTVTQLYPAVKNISHKILQNNSIELIEDGIYKADSFEVVESYDIINPVSLLEHLKAHIGSSIESAISSSAIKIDVRNTNTYSFQNNGACVIYNTTEFLSLVKNNYFGIVQANALPLPSGGKLKEYIPKTTPVVAGGKTFDVKNTADLSGLTSTLVVGKTNWEQADNPPERFLQFTENSSGTKEHGFLLGYCPTIGLGKKENRVDLVGETFSIPTSKKQYPRAVGKGNTAHASDYIQPNTFFDGVAYRIPINYSIYPEATNVSWYEVNNEIYVMIDYHSNVDTNISFPETFLNKRIDVVEKTDSFTLMSSFVSLDGIRVKVTDGYGYAVLRFV